MSRLGADDNKRILLGIRFVRTRAIRGGCSLLGVVVALLCWSYGRRNQSAPSQDHIPSRVGEGGQTVEVQAQSDSPATIRISFEDLRKPAGEQQLLESWETMSRGLKSWTIDVPSGLGGSIELDAIQPNVGDRIAIRVQVNGRLVDTQANKLEQPLEANEAFFVQDQFDDYSQAADQDTRE